MQPVLNEVRPDFAARTGFVHRAPSRGRGAERGFAPTRLIEDAFLAGPTGGEVGPPAGGGRVEVFIDHRAVEGSDGEALLFALRRAGVPLQAVCGGKGACGTCKIHVPPEWRNRAGEPSQREARLLRYLGAGEGDRLSCQIRLGTDLNGLEVQSCTNPNTRIKEMNHDDSNGPGDA